MNIQTTYQRFNPTTVNGEMIEVKTIYSSFDSAEIDALEKDIQNAIGFGTIIKADKKGGTE